MAKGKTASKAAPASLATYSLLAQAILVTYDHYQARLTPHTRALDAFLVYLVVIAVVQFVFSCVTGGFPFHGFVGSFGLAVGQFVLTVALRLQWEEEGRVKVWGKERSRGRAFGDYVATSLLLHFIVWHFVN